MIQYTVSSYDAEFVVYLEFHVESTVFLCGSIKNIDF